MRGAALFGALALAVATPLAAEVPAEWRPVDAETGQIRDLDGLEQLARDFPDSGSVRLRLLNAQLGAGNAQAVLASLAWLKERGYVFGAGAQAQIPQLLGEEHADAARALLIERAVPIEASEAIAEVPPEAGLIESVNLIGDERVLVATSVTRGEIWFVDSSGRWRSIAPPGADDLSGLVYSPADRRIWVSSGNVDESEDEAPKFAGMIGTKLGSLEFIKLAAPEGVTLSDLGFGPDGRLFASDPLSGGVYNVKTMEPLVPAGTFRSPQGLAASADGARLYVSDYRYGLATVDLASGQVGRLQTDVPVLLDGVDGLWRHGNELIAMQNGTSPMRISAFTLSDDGTRIVAARILEQAHPDWTEPLGGNIVDNALIYVATGQWDRYDKGQPVEGKPPLPTQIRMLPLD